MSHPGRAASCRPAHVDPSDGAEPIDTGAPRGTIDPDGNRIRGRLWLKSEQGERVLELRPEPERSGFATGPALAMNDAQRAAATVLPRLDGPASAAPAVPSTGRRFSRHSGMPPRNQ